jgi:hypothetical protein
VRVAQNATTIAFPGRGYAGTYNYFDPDNFIALSAMLYSGDPYLQRQVRDVVERSGEFLRVADNSSNGQLPHHFAKDVPTFLALSGATQTGPNTFWVKTALRYAHATGDLSWLQQYMPTLRNASDFCFDLIDPSMHLLDAPGSLMIDVFIRQRYTSDSNAMVVGFLRDVAEAERIVGNAQRAVALEATASEVRAAMNQHLWAAGSDAVPDGDHYITQRNPDNTTRDFVDYDSNLIAVAHGVPNSTDAMGRILARIDAGRCASAKGGGPQWVSEVYYDKPDCVGGNVGDSATAMGRIAWFDAHARKVVGTPAALKRFDADLKLLQDDLIRNTWMHERYTCDGEQMANRTNYYFEYPSVIAMLIREVRYGIDVGLHSVVISPFGPSAFTYAVGNVFVAYASGDRVEMEVPGHGPRLFGVDGMGKEGTAYEISVGQSGKLEEAYVDAAGRLKFVGVAGERVTAVKKTQVM